MIIPMPKSVLFYSLLALLVVTVGLSSNAAPVLGTENFDDGLPGGWSSVGGDGSSSVPTSGGNPNGYYKLFFPATSDPNPQQGLIYNNDASHQGDYSKLIVSFGFLVKPVSDPTVALSLYFKSSTSAATWYHGFTVPAGAWTTVSIDFTGVGWSTYAGGPNFLTVVANVIEIGVFSDIINANGSAFTLGMDNWTTSMPVPEPEALALGLVAFISLLITFRKPILAVVRRKQ